MTVHRDTERLPHFNKAVVTIGTFDGVHVGHRKIIDQLKEEAQRIGGETVIITFHPHPRKIVHVSREVKLITTIDERIRLLSDAGVDHLVIVPFTRGFSELEAREYVELFLKKKFDPSVVIIGYDHKFGTERKGDYKLLEEFSANGYFELKEIPGHVINHSTVSSTLIRNAILDGDIDKANGLLGYTFTFDGEVIKGDQRGRTIGYPTANIKLTDEEKIIPGDGVYAVKMTLITSERDKKEELLEGMMNIGLRPTVDGTKRTIEINIFDFNENIYGKKMRVFVKKFLRPEKKFSGLDELKLQLASDKIHALKHLSLKNNS